MDEYETALALGLITTYGGGAENAEMSNPNSPPAAGSIMDDYESDPMVKASAEIMAGISGDSGGGEESHVNDPRMPGDSGGGGYGEGEADTHLVPTRGGDNAVAGAFAHFPHGAASVPTEAFPTTTAPYLAYGKLQGMGAKRGRCRHQ